LVDKTNMDLIKESFARAKQDILNLQSQIEFIKNEIIQIKRTMKEITLTHNQITQAEINIIPSFQQTTNHKMPLYSLKSPITPSSIGNGGVPTDRQTNQQTDQHIGNKGVSNNRKTTKTDRISHLEKVSEVLESLDSIKKELRSKFKRLTNQEMTVFSLIYDLENRGFIVDYSLISQKLSLSESSIRDYVQKIIKKGIPIIKTKENNKKIILNINQNLKQIATLQTIQSLRDL